MARALRVEIIGDAAQYQRTLKTAGKETTGFSTTLGKLGKAAGALGLTIGAAEVVRFGLDAIHSAADVQKSTETIRTQFGKAAESVLNFTDHSAKLGVAAKDAEKTAAQFGILFHNMGLGQKQAAEMTVGFEKLATALAQIKGISPAESMQALTLAAAGNTRGLKRMGIALDSTSIKNEALKLGLIKTTKEALTPGEKAQAIYALATQNLAHFQEQAAAHAGDAANKQQQLSAEWSNAKDQLGAELLPVMTKLVTVLADNLPGAISGTIAVARALLPVWALFKPMLETMLAPIRIIIAVLQGDWGAAWDAAKAPVVAAIAAIQGLWAEAGGWLTAAGSAIIDGLWAGIQASWATVSGWFGTVFSLILGYFTGAISWLLQSGTDVLTGLWTGITNVWNTIAGWLGTVQSLFVGFFAGSVSWLLSHGQAIFTGLSDGIHAVWTTLAGWLGGMAGRISAFFAGAAGWLVSEGKSVIQGLFDGLKATWQTITGWLTQIPGFFRSFFGGAGGWLVAAGEAVIQGLWDGMKAVWNKVTGWLSSLGGAIAGLKGPPSKDYKLLQPAGEAIMAGLHVGMLRGAGSVLGLAASLGGQISNSFRAPSLGVGQAGARGSLGGSSLTATVQEIVIPVTVELDGEAIFRNQQKHAIRYKTANGTTGY